MSRPQQRVYYINCGRSGVRADIICPRYSGAYLKYRRRIVHREPRTLVSGTTAQQSRVTNQEGRDGALVSSGMVNRQISREQLRSRFGGRCKPMVQSRAPVGTSSSQNVSRSTRVMTDGGSRSKPSTTALSQEVRQNQRDRVQRTTRANPEDRLTIVRKAMDNMRGFSADFQQEVLGWIMRERDSRD